MSNSGKKPAFSIVLAVHDQASAIAENLPTLLTQQYEDYEVIVVDESSADNTADILKQLKATHSHLYTTFLPKYQFQNNKQRLAFTIGVKAAKKGWIIFADIDSLPSSEQWLQELSDFAMKPTILLLGYINRKSGEIRLKTYEDLDGARRTITKTERRKSHGHNATWLRYQRGWYDFLVVSTDKAHETLRLFENKDSIKL